VIFICPIHSCQEGDKPGWKAGDAGKCYTYKKKDKKASDKAKQEAYVQWYAMTGGKMNESVTELLYPFYQKLNYNCPASEKSGTGKGACGGSKGSAIPPAKTKEDYDKAVDLMNKMLDDNSRPNNMNDEIKKSRDSVIRERESKFGSQMADNKIKNIAMDLTQGDRSKFDKLSEEDKLKVKDLLYRAKRINEEKDNKPKPLAESNADANKLKSVAMDLTRGDKKSYNKLSNSDKERVKELVNKARLINKQR
jgi:hypothetical protein